MNGHIHFWYRTSSVPVHLIIHGGQSLIAYSKFQAQQLQQYAIQTSKNLPFLDDGLLSNLIDNDDQKILVCSEDTDERYKPSIFGMRTYVSSNDICPTPTHRTISCCTIYVTDFVDCGK